MQVPRVPGTFPHAHDPFWSAPGAGGGIWLVWAGNGNSPANTGTDGKIPVGTWDQPWFVFTADTERLHSSWDKELPNFLQGQTSPGWFHTENGFRATGKLWNLGMSRNLCGIDVVLQQSTSGASSSKDVGCLMPHFSFFESWTMCFLEGIFNFFLFCFVFKVFFIRGWTNDVLSCESKPEIFANLWSDFFSFQTILLSWNET